MAVGDEVSLKIEDSEPYYEPDPYTLLWLAVLKQGIQDARPFLRRSEGGVFPVLPIPEIESRFGRSAVRWMFSDAKYPGSFVWICVSVGLDPEKVKRLC